MALINNVNNSANATGTAKGQDSITQALGSTELGQMFTKLLVAQVQYQDPLEPTDSSTFVTQLSQLSQTESLTSLASQLSTQSSILNSLQTMQMGGQVGSTVMVQTSRVQLQDAPVQAAVSLPNAADLTLSLKAPSGKVTEVKLGHQAVGDAYFQIDPAALGLPAGQYEMTMTDANGAVYPVEVSGKLQAVRLGASGMVSLQVQGLGEVQPSSITRFVGQQA